MRLISCHLENFQSYPKLDIEFKDGLALISGPTGVGKSTVMDAVAWCLYGVTAKQTTSDQVIPWGESGRTTGIINLQGLSIFRGRSPNFLHYNDGKKGKDLKETQEFINRELGIDYDTFVAGSYFNATSPVSDFFLAKAKERR
jgi:exonuclease SbcC